jgi:hypothetical protein
LRLGFASVGNLVELRSDVGRLVEFDADFERGPHAVVAVQDPWSFFGVRQGIDRELRRAYWTVEAVASTPEGVSAGLDISVWGSRIFSPISFASNHRAWSLEQTARTVKAYDLFCDASWAFYVMALFAVQQIFWREKRVVGTRIMGIERLLFVGSFILTRAARASLRA